METLTSDKFSTGKRSFYTGSGGADFCSSRPRSLPYSCIELMRLYLPGLMGEPEYLSFSSLASPRALTILSKFRIYFLISWTSCQVSFSFKLKLEAYGYSLYVLFVLERQDTIWVTIFVDSLTQCARFSTVIVRRNSSLKFSSISNFLSRSGNFLFSIDKLKLDQSIALKNKYPIACLLIKSDLTSFWTMRKSVNDLF